MKKILLLSVLMLFTVCSVKAADDFGILIFNHRIAIGMSYGNVQASWGKPDKVDRSVSSNGTREYWFFRAKNCMVVFESGRVVSFHEY